MFMLQILAPIPPPEPIPEPRPVSPKKIVLKLVDIGVLLTIVYWTISMIFLSHDRFEISVVAVLPNGTQVRCLMLSDDANIMPMRGVIVAQVKNFVDKTENQCFDGLPMEYWDSGKNQTIPCNTKWIGYYQEDLTNLVVAPKIFEIPPMKCTGNETVVSLDGECEYSVVVINGTDPGSILVMLYVLAGVLVVQNT